MNLYPGQEEAEMERRKRSHPNDDYEEPDVIGMAPNYDAFPGWTPEEVLVFLNMD